MTPEIRKAVPHSPMSEPEMLHESGFDNIGTHYTRVGPLGAPAIVLIHGLGMNQNFWQPQIANLAQDYQVIVYDFFGHGESPMPDDDISLDDMVDQLHGLLHELEVGEAHITGHSMGALIATGFALAYPGQTLSLIAMNGVYDRPPEARKAALARAAEILSGEVSTGNEVTFQRWFGASPCENQQAAIDWIKAQLAGIDPTGYGRIYRLFSRSDTAYTGRLEALECPALFLTGDLDPNSTPEMSGKMAKAAPKGQAISLNGERHMMSLVSPGPTTTILRRFLAGQAEGAHEAA